MTDGNVNHDRPGTSSGNPGFSEIFNTGINPEMFYPLDRACVLAGIGVKHKDHIKRKYKGNGVHVWGHDAGCYGRDLIRIFIEESETADE